MITPSQRSLVVFFLLLECQRTSLAAEPSILRAPPQGRDEAPPAAPPPRSKTDWCIEGLDVLADDACYVLPRDPTDTLLLYLHGIIPPSGDSVQKEKVETVVASAARRAGVAAFIPRGRQGLAPQENVGWWGWPTGEAPYQRYAPAMIKRFRELRERLERLRGAPFSHLYLAGSSSGAYFVTLLALHGDLEADGFAAISGGSARAFPNAGHVRKPFYIGYGAHDPARAGAIALGANLRGDGWIVREAEHPLPHGTNIIYLDEAFAFWHDHAESP